MLPSAATPWMVRLTAETATTTSSHVLQDEVHSRVSSSLRIVVRLRSIRRRRLFRLKTVKFIHIEHGKQKIQNSKSAQ